MSPIAYLLMCISQTNMEHLFFKCGTLKKPNGVNKFSSRRTEGQN